MNSCLFRTADGICGPDISKPGQQVVCYAAGCKDFEPRITTQDLNRDAGTNA